VLAGGGGIVLGTVFDREADAASVRPLSAFTETQSFLISRSAGRRLVHDFWGRYVAFIPTTHPQRLLVLRDPVGSLPCFSVVTGGVRLFFSTASDIAPLGILNPEIDWTFMAAHVVRPRYLRCHQTAFKGVEEVLPGECWSVGHGNGRITRQLYWSPTQFSTLDKDDVTGLVARLRATTELCVAAWASCYPRVTHLLSGGIDSSIVLYCLRNRRLDVEVTALNYFNTFSSYADERPFARLAAASTQCPLVEVEEDPASADLKVLMTAPASVKPPDMQYYQTHSALEREVTDRTCSSAVFNGTGGDHLFYLSPLSLSAADYVAEQGVDRYLLTLCNEIARYEDTLFWNVLAASVRDGWRFRQWDPNLHIRKIRLATPKANLEALDSGMLDPPWLALADGLPMGKLEHLRAASVANDFYHPMAPRHSPERVSPLVSQPLIELCLSVPLYILAWHGQDRIIAREAFRNCLPREIIERRAKGIADAFMQRLFARNASFAREILLDGLLVANGYLDRRKLEGVLLRPEGKLMHEAAEVVMFHCNTECFLRRVSTNWSHHV
jgi:asparagine synthase (glutamine-hydrolysing)